MWLLLKLNSILLGKVISWILTSVVNANSNNLGFIYFENGLCLNYTSTRSIFENVSKHMI